MQLQYELDVREQLRLGLSGDLLGAGQGELPASLRG
jgi:hypothetical protein